jgi:hypothetical protein
VIGVNDFAEKSEKYDEATNTGNIQKIHFFLYMTNQKDISKHFKLNLSTFTNNKNFSFKYLSNFRKWDIWDSENNLLLGAISGFKNSIQ